MVARDRLTGWVEIVARCDRARVHCVCGSFAIRLRFGVEWSWMWIGVDSSK